MITAIFLFFAGILLGAATYKPERVTCTSIILVALPYIIFYGLSLFIKGYDNERIFLWIFTVGFLACWVTARAIYDSEIKHSKK